MAGASPVLVSVATTSAAVLTSHQWICPTVWDHFTRRPAKAPLFVVFCLMFAVSPCSAMF
jgi:hypothetical protein